MFYINYYLKKWGIAFKSIISPEDSNYPEDVTKFELAAVGRGSNRTILTQHNTNRRDANTYQIKDFDEEITFE